MYMVHDSLCEDYRGIPAALVAGGFLIWRELRGGSVMVLRMLVLFWCSYDWCQALTAACWKTKSVCDP